eukprot:Transcript_25463.p2 GENE.Transcript_25463~~Transcript_25463.p2  ORF type:complete len:201 (-),score=25.07 Transcript_25463:172-774(-)
MATSPPRISKYSEQARKHSDVKCKPCSPREDGVAPKDGLILLGDGRGGGKSGGTHAAKQAFEHKAGDWQCRAELPSGQPCNNHNMAWRTVCHRETCGAMRPDLEVIELKKELLKARSELQAMKRADVKNGDAGFPPLANEERRSAFSATPAKAAWQATASVSQVGSLAPADVAVLQQKLAWFEHMWAVMPTVMAGPSPAQ